MSTLVSTFQNDYFEANVILAATKENMSFLVPRSETALRDIVVKGVAKFIDSQLLNPSVSATSAHPASLTNGATPVTSSGPTAANIITDLAALIAAIETPGDGLRWIMRPLTYASICAKLAGVGYPATPGFLLGIPVIAGSTSPQQITLVDAASIAVSYDDAIAVDLTTASAIEMVDSSSQSAIDGTGAQMVSLFQLGAVGIKATLAASWQSVYFNSGSPSQPAGVAYMTVSYRGHAMTKEELAALVRGITTPLKEQFAARDTRLAALEARVKQLEALPTMKDAGVWTHGRMYSAGSIVSHQGSAWICSDTHYSTGTDLDHGRFRLLVKKGRDGKDGRPDEADAWLEGARRTPRPYHPCV